MTSAASFFRFLRICSFSVPTPSKCLFQYMIFYKMPVNPRREQSQLRSQCSVERLIGPGTECFAVLLRLSETREGKEAKFLGIEQRGDASR